MMVSATLTGGSDTDLFIYQDGGLGSGTDTITDSADGVSGDQLVLYSFLTGYDPQSSSISEFVLLLHARLRHYRNRQCQC
jgi:hypothetical protein